MMRIAVAGGGGLGYLIATELAQAANAYNVVVLSRGARPEYADYDVQVLPVDYSDHRALCYALQGVHLVISTFSGTEQLSLINAAGHSGVRLFVPAEFEGSLSRRPSRNDPLDRGSSQALSLLRQWTQSSRMKYTVFSCGIFMERFLPYGLGSLSIGFGSGAAGVGDFLVDFNNATAEYVERDARGHSVRVCLTSVYDVARFVVAAIEIGPGNWPREFTMRGDRMSVRDLVGACSQARNIPFSHERRQMSDVQSYAAYWTQQGDYERALYYQRLLTTACGRYDFGQATLNDAVNANENVDVQPRTFAQWLQGI